MEKWPIACCFRDCSASSSNSFAGNRGFPRGSLTARACNGTRESESGDNVKLRKGMCTCNEKILLSWEQSIGMISVMALQRETAMALLSVVWFPFWFCVIREKSIVFRY